MGGTHVRTLRGAHRTTAASATALTERFSREGFSSSKAHRRV